MVKWQTQKTKIIAKPQRQKAQPNEHGNREERRAAKAMKPKPEENQET